MKWHENLIEKAKVFIQNGQSLQPVLFLRSDKKISIIPLGRFAGDKDDLATLLHMIVHFEDPDEYMYLTEAYVKVVDQKDGGDTAVGTLLADGTLQVSQLPSAKEAITILLGDRKGERIGMVIFEREGKTILFEETKWMEGDSLSGRFTDLRHLGPFLCF